MIARPGARAARARPAPGGGRRAARLDRRGHGRGPLPGRSRLSCSPCRPAPTRSPSRPAGSPGAPARAAGRAVRLRRCRRRPSRRAGRRAGASTTLGRPALAGDRLLFHVAGAARGRIVEIRLATGGRRTLRSAPRALLLNPSSYGRPAALRALDVRAPAAADRRPARRPVRRDRSLYGTVPTGRRDAGHEPGESTSPRPPEEAPAAAQPGVSVTLWSTALARRRRLRHAAAPGRGQPVRATLLRVPR